MGESNRGTYDADQIRVFDGSEDDDDAEGSRLPVLIVIALVVLASFAGVVWLAYQKGVASGRSEPRVVVADTDNPSSSAPSGNPTEYKGLKIYEQPAPNDADQAPAPQKAMGAQTAPKSQSVTVSPPLRAPVTEPADNTVTAQSVSPAPAVAKPAPEKKVAVAAPVTPKPVVTNPVTATPSDASSPPRTLAPAVTVPPAHATGGAYLLQIGSYKSEDEANAAWASDKRKFGSVLAGYSPDVKQVDLGEKGTWYRLRIASFADKAAANDMCDKLKAAGGSCIIAK